MKSFYLICAKCGSDDLIFIRYPTRNGDGSDFEDVFVSCSNCGTLTCLDEHNDNIFSKVQKDIATELRSALDE